MTGLMVRLQLTTWLRDRRILAMLCAAVVLLAVAAAGATASDVARRTAQLEAATSARTQWETRGAEHPHRRAHFGDYVFRPTGPLARLDRGVAMRLGKVVRIEAHRQGAPLHSDASRAGTIARFTPPDPAFLLQQVVPLLLIFLGATGVASDRRAGRMKLALVQGASARSIATGHWFSLWSFGLVLLGVVLLASGITSLTLDGAGEVSLSRLLGFSLAYATFFALVAAIVVVASLWSASARSALLGLMAFWVLGSTLLPRAASAIASSLHPLPSQDAFLAEMQEAREAGPDGHNPEDEAIEAKKQELLEQYGVTRTEDLPLDFGGIAMQMDEDFGNEVWDTHYGRLRDQLSRQRQVMTVTSLLNPFQAVDHISMSVTGTDLAHDLALQLQAERYRRDLVRALNHEHAHGAPKTRGGPWEASSAFYEGLASFRYTPASPRDVMWTVWPEWASLAAWNLLLLFGLRRGSDLLNRGELSC